MQNASLHQQQQSHHILYNELYNCELVYLHKYLHLEYILKLIS